MDSVEIMWTYIILINVFLVLCVKLYCILTCGINKCSKHIVGKVVIVTGGNAGIGFETAKDLADRGARVIIACRNEGRGTTARDYITAATNNQDIHYRHLDLASFSSVRKFAQEILSTEKRLDVLINNAGVIELKNTTSEDGLTLGMQINHFGPFLLTNLLLPLLKSTAPSRIINVSSTAYRAGDVDFQNFEKICNEKFSVMGLYSTTKLCNVLMTIELDRLLKRTGVTVNCLHPGAVSTSILVGAECPWLKYRVVSSLLGFLNKSAWEGAQTSIYLAVSPEVKEVSGLYFTDCHVSNLTDKIMNPDLARKVWEVSERIVKLK